MPLPMRPPSGGPAGFWRPWPCSWPFCCACWQARRVPCALAAAALAFLGYRRMALGQFGGITGDLQGWFVQMGEVLVLAALVLGQKIW